MDEILAEEIIEEVLRRIREIEKKKVLFLIRKEDMSFKDEVKEIVNVLVEKDLYIHLAFEDIREIESYNSLDDKNIRIIDYPKSSIEIGDLFKEFEYEFMLINYIKIKETNQIKDLKIDEGFSSILFYLIYQDVEIYTRIYELVGECKNDTLNQKLSKYLKELELFNIKTLHNKEDLKSYGEKTLEINKSVLTFKDMYELNIERVVLDRDTIITDEAREYIKENDISVRRR